MEYGVYTFCGVTQCKPGLGELSCSQAAFHTSSPYAVSLGWHDGCINKMTHKPCKLGQTDLVFCL